VNGQAEKEIRCQMKNKVLLVLIAMVFSAITGLALSEDWNSYHWWTAFPEQHPNSGSFVNHPAFARIARHR